METPGRKTQMQWLDANLKCQIIHLDDTLIVLDKAAGLLAVPGRGAENQVNLAGQVQGIYPDALVVHRLERETTGVMGRARGGDGQWPLRRKFAERRGAKIEMWAGWC